MGDQAACKLACRCPHQDNPEHFATLTHSMLPTSAEDLEYLRRDLDPVTIGTVKQALTAMMSPDNNARQGSETFFRDFMKDCREAVAILCDIGCQSDEIGQVSAILITKVLKASGRPSCLDVATVVARIWPCSLDSKPTQRRWPHVWATLFCLPVGVDLLNGLGWLFTSSDDRAGDLMTSIGEGLNGVDVLGTPALFVNSSGDLHPWVYQWLEAAPRLGGAGLGPVLVYVTQGLFDVERSVVERAVHCWSSNKGNITDYMEYLPTFILAGNPENLLEHSCVLSRSEALPWKSDPHVALQSMAYVEYDELHLGGKVWRHVRRQLPATVARLREALNEEEYGSLRYLLFPDEGLETDHTNPAYESRLRRACLMLRELAEEIHGDMCSPEASRYLHVRKWVVDSLQAAGRPPILETKLQFDEEAADDCQSLESLCIQRIILDSDVSSVVLTPAKIATLPADLRMKIMARFHEVQDVHLSTELLRAFVTGVDTLDCKRLVLTRPVYTAISDSVSSVTSFQLNTACALGPLKSLWAHATSLLVLDLEGCCIAGGSLVDALEDCPSSLQELSVTLFPLDFPRFFSSTLPRFTELKTLSFVHDCEEACDHIGVEHRLPSRLEHLSVPRGFLSSAHYCAEKLHSLTSTASLFSEDSKLNLDLPNLLSLTCVLDDLPAARQVPLLEDVRILMLPSPPPLSSEHIAELLTFPSLRKIHIRDLNEDAQSVVDVLLAIPSNDIEIVVSPREALAVALITNDMENLQAMT